MKRMKVLLLDEGTPGHTAQTKGVGQMLVDKMDADVDWLECRLKLPGWKRGLARFLVGKKKKGSARAMAERLYPGVTLPSDRYDLIISSCGKSAYLNRLLKAETGAKSIFIGERKPFPKEWFDLIVTPVREGLEHELLMPVIEAGQSPATAAVAVEAFWPKQVPKSCWTILIGGASRTHRFEDADWLQLAEGINALGARYGIRWLLSTSRRTGPEAEKILMDHIDDEFLAESIWYSQEPRKCVAAFIGAGDRVFVTQDSLTMMSECLLVNKRVDLLVPRDWEMPEGSFNGGYVGRLIGEKLVGRLSIVDMSQFSPPGNGYVDVSLLRESFSIQLCDWVKSNVISQ